MFQDLVQRALDRPVSKTFLYREINPHEWVPGMIKYLYWEYQNELNAAVALCRAPDIDSGEPLDLLECAKRMYRFTRAKKEYVISGGEFMLSEYHVRAASIVPLGVRIRRASDAEWARLKRRLSGNRSVGIGLRMDAMEGDARASIMHSPSFLEKDTDYLHDSSVQVISRSVGELANELSASLGGNVRTRIQQVGFVGFTDGLEIAVRALARGVGVNLPHRAPDINNAANLQAALFSRTVTQRFNREMDSDLVEVNLGDFPAMADQGYIQAMEWAASFETRMQNRDEFNLERTRQMVAESPLRQVGDLDISLDAHGNISIKSNVYGLDVTRSSPARAVSSAQVILNQILTGSLGGANEVRV